MTNSYKYRSTENKYFNTEGSMWFFWKINPMKIFSQGFSSDHHILYLIKKIKSGLPLLGLSNV